MPALERFGEHKFPRAGLLASSRDRRWRGIAAELRAHPAGEVPAICPNHMEITLAIDGVEGAAVERRGNGVFQRTAVDAGKLWFCPIGVREDSIRITHHLPRILHVYLPHAQFVQVTQSTSRRFTPGAIPYLAGVDDELIRQIALRICRELESETASGAMLVEHLALSLALHLATTYASEKVSVEDQFRPGRLDRGRLTRVTGYIEENLRSELSIAELAGVACLSPHHFARAFREATGLPPHRFVTVQRLQRAKQMLLDAACSIQDIAVDCNFSSQTSFTRAFRKHFGTTPGEFRAVHRT